MASIPPLRRLARHPSLVLGGVLVLLLTMVVVQGWQFAVRGLRIGVQDSTEASNRTLTRVFVNENWETVKPLLPPPGSGPEAARANPSIDAIDQVVRRFSSYTDVLKVKIYDRRGITVYSSDRSQIGEDKARNLGFQAAARGQVASELTYRGTFGAFDGELYNRNLVSTYVPVRVGTEIEAVLEIYSDRTASIEFTNRELRSLALWTVPWVLGAVLLLAGAAWCLRREEQARARQASLAGEQARRAEAAAAVAQAAVMGRSELLPAAFEGLGAVVARVGVSHQQAAAGGEAAAWPAAGGGAPSDLDDLLVRAATIDRWARVRSDLSWLEPDTDAPASLPAVFELDPLLDELIAANVQQGAWRACQVSSYRHPARLGAVQADRERLTTLLGHLLAAAVEAASGSGTPSRVQCKFLREGATTLHVDVVDDSPGLPQERLDGWFQAWGLGRELPPADGEGLTARRLLLVRTLAHQSGGSFTARGTPGHGNRWLLELPLHNEDGRRAAA